MQHFQSENYIKTSGLSDLELVGSLIPFPQSIYFAEYHPHARDHQRRIPTMNWPKEHGPGLQTVEFVAFWQVKCESATHSGHSTHQFVRITCKPKGVIEYRPNCLKDVQQRLDFGFNKLQSLALSSQRDLARFVHLLAHRAPRHPRGKQRATAANQSTGEIFPHAQQATIFECPAARAAWAAGSDWQTPAPRKSPPKAPRTRRAPCAS